MLVVVVVPSPGMSLEHHVSHLVRKKEGNTGLSDNNSTHKPITSQQQRQQVDTKVSNGSKLIKSTATMSATSTTVSTSQYHHHHHHQVDSDSTTTTLTITGVNGLSCVILTYVASTNTITMIQVRNTGSREGESTGSLTPGLDHHPVPLPLSSVSAFFFF